MNEHGETWHVSFPEEQSNRLRWLHDSAHEVVAESPCNALLEMQRGDHSQQNGLKPWESEFPSARLAEEFYHEPTISFVGAAVGQSRYCRVLERVQGVESEVDERQAAASECRFWSVLGCPRCDVAEGPRDDYDAAHW